MEAEHTSITKSAIKMVFMITYHKVVMQNQLYTYHLFSLSSLLLLFCGFGPIPVHCDGEEDSQ